MAFLPGLRKLLSERPGARFVADEVGANRLVREALEARVCAPPPLGSPPDVVALVDGVPLVVRRHVPVCTVYAVQPEKIPSPTRDDHDLAISVARSIKLA